MKIEIKVTEPTVNLTERQKSIVKRCANAMRENGYDVVIYWADKTGDTPGVSVPGVYEFMQQYGI